MREIIVGRVWIGNTRDASDIRGILEKEIAAVVNLAIEELPILYPREVISCRFPLLDGEGNSEALLRVAIFTVPHDVAPALWNDVKASIAWMFSDRIDTAVNGANQTLH